MPGSTSQAFSPLATLPASTTVDVVVDTLGREGYAVIEGVLTPDHVAAVRGELTELLEGVPSGRNGFEGFRTRRLYAV